MTLLTDRKSKTALVNGEKLGLRLNLRIMPGQGRCRTYDPKNARVNWANGLHDKVGSNPLRYQRNRKTVLSKFTVRITMDTT